MAIVIERAGMTYHVGYADQKLSAAFLAGTEDDTGSAPIPQLFILGRDGQLVEHLIGDAPQNTARLQQVISQQLSLNASSD